MGPFEKIVDQIRGAFNFGVGLVGPLKNPCWRPCLQPVSVTVESAPATTQTGLEAPNRDPKSTVQMSFSISFLAWAYICHTKENKLLSPKQSPFLSTKLPVVHASMTRVIGSTPRVTWFGSLWNLRLRVYLSRVMTIICSKIIEGTFFRDCFFKNPRNFMKLERKNNI